MHSVSILGLAGNRQEEGVHIASAFGAHIYTRFFASETVSGKETRARQGVIVDYRHRSVVGCGFNIRSLFTVDYYHARQLGFISSTRMQQRDLAAK